MDKKLYIIAEKFDKKLGVRYRTQGKRSGEEFFEDYLKDEFLNVIKDNQILDISFDGVSGHPPSFIDEAFGLLTCAFGKEKVKKHLDISYSRGKWLKGKIFEIIETAEIKRNSDECKKM